MSLYTLSKYDKLPSTKRVRGIRIERCSNLKLLSEMGTTTIDDVAKRLSDGHVAFVAYIYNQPAAFGWMARKTAMIGELNHQIDLPKGNRYLWNFRTMEKYRGLGIYPALLQYIISYEIEKADRFWIIHAPENKASLSGIIKAGFLFIGTLYINEFGNAVIEPDTDSGNYEMLLGQMKILVMQDSASSCWNCSSPYLKKRMMECCCAKAKSECIGKNEDVMTA